MRTVKSCCLFLAMPIIIPETSAIPLTTSLASHPPSLAGMSQAVVARDYSPSSHIELPINIDRLLLWPMV